MLYEELASSQTDLGTAQDTLDIIAYPSVYTALSQLRVWDAMATTLPATAANDDLGLVTGTFLTDFPYVTCGNVNNATATRRAAYFVTLPETFDPATSSIAVRILWARPDAAAVSATLDVEAAALGNPSVDLCATAAQSVNAAASGTATFELDEAGLTAGEQILVRVTIAMDDTAGGGSEIRLSEIALAMSVAE